MFFIAMMMASGSNGATLVEPVYAQTLTYYAEINKSFTPIEIIPGGISRLRVTIYNPNAFQLTDAAWTDNLAGVQPGIRISNPVNLTNTCGGSVTAIAGSTTLALSGGIVPAKTGGIDGSCTVAIDVTSITPGNLINTIPAGGLTASGNGGDVTNSTPASATLQVDTIAPPSLNKNFDPNTVWVGQTSKLTINIINNDLVNALTQTSLTDNLPANVFVVNNPPSVPAPTFTGTGCTGTVTAPNGAASVQLTNATIPKNTICSIIVYVRSSVANVYTNRILAGAIQTKEGVTNSGNAVADLNVQAVGIAKAFSPTTIQAGETSLLTITLRNPTGTPFTGVTLTDTLPGSVLEFIPGTEATTCASGSETLSFSGSLPRSITLSGGRVPSGNVTNPGSCTITVRVTTPPGASTASHLNTINAMTMITDQGITNVLPATASLSVQALSIGVVKAFSPTTFQAGGVSTLTITLQNRTSNQFTGVGFTDDLPAGLLISGTPISPQCGGTVTSTGASITLSGGSIPPGTVATPGICVITAQVTVDPATPAGSYTNSIPAGQVTSDQGVTNLSASNNAVVSVYATGTGVTGSKQFLTPSISVGGVSRLRIDLFAPPDQALTNVTLTDALPSGVTISASPSPSISGCGAAPPRVLTAAPNSTTITLTGGAIAAGARCRIEVNVTSSTPGTFRNFIEPADFDNAQHQTLANSIYGDLSVSTLTMSKAFYPDVVNPNGLSRLTITLTNTNASPLVDVSLIDPLPFTNATNGVFVAPDAKENTTCPGGSVSVVTNANGSQSVVMTGGTIPAQVLGVPGLCTVSINVQGKGAATTRTNTIPRLNVSGKIAGVGTVINPVSDASAPLTIRNLTIGVVKGFEPLTVFGGSSSTMSIILSNPNNAILTGIEFTDTMPSGMLVANPANVSNGACRGTLTANPGDSTFTFKDGVLEPGKKCTLTLSITMTVNGNLTNIIQAADVKTFNGASNPQAAQASLTNLPGASVSKSFSPNPIVAEAGNYSLLTITIKNTGNIPLTGMGLTDTLPGTLPAGLFIAGPPAPAATTTCGGTLTAQAGTQQILLTGGSLAGNGFCTIEVPVTSTTSGKYSNIILAGALKTNEEATNLLPAEDTLTVTSAPELQLSKVVTSAGPYHVNDFITYELTATNRGNITLTNVTITDPGVTFTGCTPAQPATLPPGHLLTCTASHPVTQADYDAGVYTNTATADSDQTDPVTDTVTVPVPPPAALNVVKRSTSTGPYTLGSTLTYEIIVRNIGRDPLTGITLTDAGAGAILEGCLPAQPAALAFGETMTCTARHVVTQADVDAGFYRNTAVADSVESEPASDTVIIPITRNPALEVYKQLLTNPPYALGTTLTYDIAVVNKGDQTLTGVTVTDPGANVTLGACTPAAPATLGLGEIMSCAATHVVSQADIDTGSFSNTAYGDSDQTSAAADTERVDFTQIPSIELTKNGTLDLGVVAPNGVANVGDTITYAFTVRNSGNVTLKDVTITDTVGGVVISGGPISSLAPGASDSTTYTGVYTLKQGDIDAGSFANTATVKGTPPNGLPEVTDTDDDKQTLGSVPVIGVAKRVAGAPVKVSPGTWDVTYEILVRNYGNVTLKDIQVVDNLAAVFPALSTFAVQSLTSTDFTINPAYNGSTDIHLLAGTDTLGYQEDGIITLVVRVVPASPGPFNNTAVGSGTPPSGLPVQDDSQDGLDPDPAPSDGDPTNNNDPTPLDFGPNLFDPPSGIKSVNTFGLPVLRWTMVWINNANFVAVNATASDGIPAGTIFADNGVPSGYPLPPGPLPAGSVASGVVCEDTSVITTTQYCYYEGPTAGYPRGRIIWQGVLGPDMGVTDPVVAVNDVSISFDVQLLDGVLEAQNRATIDSDLNGDGDALDPGEQNVATAVASWKAPGQIPVTGFATGVITQLPAQPLDLAYFDMGGMLLEIPTLGLHLPIVGIPLSASGDWDVTWLGNNAGYLAGTAFPTWPGNTVITAHVWDARNNPGPFARLKELRYGDIVRIRAWGKIYTYEVRESKLILAKDLTAALKHEELDWVTLLTCEGYHAGSQNYSFRRLVRAVLVSVSDE
ncbi:MAG: sortase [Anaerolineae bacterium]|nr:sortase [Anaerolineae bacterium]